MSIHFHPLTITDIRKETPDCVSLSFGVPAGLEEIFRFHQGQNLTLKANIGGEELRRSYSICSAPHEKELRVAVKKAPFGKFSGYANQELQPGDILDVLPPTGQFYTPLHPSNKKNYLAFAAGSGITPILSILKEILHTEKQSRFTLVYGNQRKESIIFREALEAIKNRYMERFQLIHLLSREETEIPIHSGRIDKEKCVDLFRTLIDWKNMDEIFICGPEAMIWSVKEFLEEKSFPKGKIHFELFTTPQDQTDPSRPNSFFPLKKISENGIDIQMKLDGILTQFKMEDNEKTILNAALEAGYDLPYACKGGVCSTCRAKLLEGRVSMDVHYALSDEEMEAGFILTCQSHPQSEKIFIDYDER